MRNTWVLTVRRYLEKEARRILWEDYEIEVETDTPVRYYLDFKSDTRLVDLREALERLDRGRFGVCLRCGGPIEVQMLKAAPGMQFCLKCTDSMHFGVDGHPQESLLHRETKLPFRV